MQPSQEQGIAFTLDRKDELDLLRHTVLNPYDRDPALYATLVGVSSNERLEAFASRFREVMRFAPEFAITINEVPPVRIACEHVMAARGLARIGVFMSGERRPAKRILRALWS